MKNEKLNKAFSHKNLTKINDELINHSINRIIYYKQHNVSYRDLYSERVRSDIDLFDSTKRNKIKLKKIDDNKIQSPKMRTIEQEKKKKNELISSIIEKLDIKKKGNKVNIKRLSKLIQFKANSQEIVEKGIIKRNARRPIFSFDNNISSNATNDNSITPFSNISHRKNSTLSFSSVNILSKYTLSNKEKKRDSIQFLNKFACHHKVSLNYKKKESLNSIINDMYSKVPFGKYKGVSSPYENCDITLSKIKDKVFYADKGDNDYITSEEEKIKNIQIKNNMNRFDSNFIDYLSEKYFDCFEELASKASGVANYRRANSLFNNFKINKRKSTRKVDEHFSSLSYEELDRNNRFYIDKFIIIEKKKIFNIVKKQINDEEMKKRKRFIRKQSTYKINVRQNKTIHHQLIIKKVNDFRVLSNEEQFNRNKSNIVLNPKFLSILSKLKGQKKVKLLSIDTEEEINKYKTDLYTILLYHIRSLNEIEFISTYNTNKSMLDVNQQDSEMNTLLIYATKYNCYKICEYLLSNQCDPNIQNSFGNTALHYAISYKHFDIVNLLINSNADENIRNSMKKTPWECSNINPEEDNL